MRRSIGLVGGILLAAACATSAIVASCGGTGGGSAPRTPQFVLKPVGTTSNSGSFVMGIARSSIDANNADRVDVTARVLDPDRRPLGGVGITFRASFPDVSFLGARAVPGQDFPTAEAITDATGTAVVTVKAGGTPGRLSVEAVTSNINLNLGGVVFLQLTDVGFISGNLQVLPAEISLTDPTAGTALEFLVVGGEPFRVPNPPYVLQNATSGIGTAELLDDGQFPVVIRYTVSGKLGGSHVFSVVDAIGTSVTGTVTVTFSTLTILPASASLVGEQTQVFALTGGVPPYVCTPSGGTLNPTTILERGGTTEFTAEDPVVTTTFTILCTDVSGQIATASVTVTPKPTPTPAPSGSPGPPATPTPTPQNLTTIVVQADPASLNGVEGGTSTITATLLDQNNDAVPGVNVLFRIVGGGDTPTPTVPSIAPITAPSGSEGQAVSVLTVPGGTTPQFVVVTASARAVTGQGQVAVTSQRTNPPGPPARLNAALFKANGSGDNNDGTLVTVFSALVTDANGNPVADGVEVDWGPIQPTSVTVLSPTFTNGDPPCDITPYETNTGIAVVPQPGTALTCVIYPAALANIVTGSVRVTVPGTSLLVTSTFILPGPAPTPTPPPVPTPTPTPEPTPTP